jgi:hypothetical protein
MAPVKCYIFDKQSLQIPMHLNAIAPRQVHLAITNVRLTASMAFQTLKKLDNFYHKRFHRMCYVAHERSYYLHAESIDRLLKWRNDFDDCTGLRTLAPCAKIPSFTLRFCVDEGAYAQYVLEFARLREEYIQGPYVRWLVTKRKMENAFLQTTMREMDRKQWLLWWTKFLAEMAKWEERINEMLLPTWADIVNQLFNLIEERVELNEQWDDDLYLPTPESELL